jgi:two-component system alkaline phosphatase synthesis response regulator PhoP
MSAESRPLIVVVADEPELLKIITEQLTTAGFSIQSYTRGTLAASFLQLNVASLLLIDLTPPDPSGSDLCQALNQQGINMPMLFITGNSLAEERLQKIKRGAADCLTKPLNYPDLLTRIHTILRQAKAKADTPIAPKPVPEPFYLLSAQIDPGQREILFTNGTRHKIGRKEIGILAYLSAHRGVVISRKELLQAVWGMHADLQSRSLDQYIVKIRTTYARQGLTLDCLKTVHGVGYLFDPPSSAKAAACGD